MEEICSKIWTKPIKGQREGIQKVGLEMEFHSYDSVSLAPMGTEGARLNPQILLNRIAQSSADVKIKYDNETALAVGAGFQSGANFSIEPGGQIEYSSAPFEKITDLAADVTEKLKILETAAAGELIFLSHGTNPIAKPDHHLVLAKERYKIMTRYFQSAPHLRCLDMMRHTATVQANIDIFGDKNWEDAVHLVLVLIPLTNALFANSRYFKSEKSHFTSERQEIWNCFDPTRSGIPAALPFAENIECVYAQWAKKANVMLIENLPTEQQPLYNEITFEAWLKQGYKGTKPKPSDWETHLTTLFPHLRLRDFLEIRHIDAQPFEHTLAPVAFFSALIQNKQVRTELWELLKKHSVDFKTLFNAKEKSDFSELYFPLLDFACDVLAHSKEYEGMRAVAAYKNFILEKENYWGKNTALEFLQKRKTHSPSADFQKNF